MVKNCSLLEAQLNCDGRNGLPRLKLLPDILGALLTSGGGAFSGCERRFLNWLEIVLLTVSLNDG